MILVDSNVLIDVRTRDRRWFDWSASQLAAAADRSELAINPIIFAELSIDAEAIEALEEELPAHLYRRLALPYEAAFLAGRAFLSYRRRGGRRRSPFPDFYIGAHAAVSRLTLLTRDSRRYRTYFPTVELISPS